MEDTKSGFINATHFTQWPRHDLNFDYFCPYAELKAGKYSRTTSFTIIAKSYSVISIFLHLLSFKQQQENFFAIFVENVKGRCVQFSNNKLHKIALNRFSSHATIMESISFSHISRTNFIQKSVIKATP